ncbi:hypothetical protein ACI8AF_02225 [Blastococcus sp. SYSU D00669]
MRPDPGESTPTQLVAVEPAAEPEAEPPAPAGRSDPTPLRGSSAALEFLSVLVLSVTTILTAWSAFEASKWGGEMSIAFSQASSARIEAARADATAHSRLTNQVGLWTEWVVAEGTGNPALAAFVADRFPEPLATAHQEWLAAGGATPGAPESPFQLPSYVLPEALAAAAADERADGLFATALENNQRSDNYTILTVLFAAVLFFSAMSGRARAYRSQRLLLGTGLLLGVVGLFFLATFPKLV